MLAVIPQLLALVLLAANVSAHANVTSPAIRQPGSKFLAKCGQTSFDAVKSDVTGHIEEQEPVNAGCELTLCRGMLFEDQPQTSIQQVIPGQEMTLAVDCTIPHGGPANVSLIDTTGGGAGKFIGSFLKSFDDFCPTTGTTPADQSSLKFNLPSTAVIGNKCQKAGDCVVQLFWATPDFSQNYYYCVDVNMAKAAKSAPAVTKPTPPVLTKPAPDASKPAPAATNTAPVQGPAASESDLDALIARVKAFLSKLGLARRSSDVTETETIENLEDIGEDLEEADLERRYFEEDEQDLERRDDEAEEEEEKEEEDLELHSFNDENEELDDEDDDDDDEEDLELRSFDDEDEEDEEEEE